ncbi:MAG TPA: response regulator [Terriglobales bacterium]|nr:response regulator [Terriglobales bacterium]
MPPIRILFVDDEEAIRLTLPPILEKHGFVCEVTATVPQALAKIGSELFDVLIADLNVGQPGDGFTVVSAMRRTQPNCVNLILTGYPAFETALEAIRQQVDDYIVKPTDISSLIQFVERKLRERKPHQPLAPKRVAAILRESIDEIVALALEKMKANPDLQRIRLTDSQRVDHLPRFIEQMANTLESQARPSDLIDGATEHGRLRRKQKYSAPLLVEDARAVDEAIYQVVQKNLLSVDVSYLIADLGTVNSVLEIQLKESLKAYTSKAA